MGLCTGFGRTLLRSLAKKVVKQSSREMSF